MAIGDFATREAAEEAFQRITGIPFGSHEVVAARLRVMHAGESLLTSLQEAIRICEAMRYTAGLGKNQLERIERAKATINEVTGRVA